MKCKECVVQRFCTEKSPVLIRRQSVVNTELKFVMSSPRASFIDPAIMPNNNTIAIFSRYVKSPFDVIFTKNCAQSGRIEKVAEDRKARESCSDTFKKDLKGAKVIVACGNTALEALGYDRKVSQSTGWVHYNEELGASVMAAEDPHDVEDAPDSKAKDFIWTILHAEKILQNEVPDRNIKPDIPYTVVSSVKHFKRLVALIPDEELVIAIDDETGGLEFYDPSHEILMIGLYTPSTGAIVVPEAIVHSAGFAEAIEELGARCNVSMAFHNGKFDAKFNKHKADISLRIDEDTIVLHQMIDERTGIHGLERLSRVYMNYEEYWLRLKEFVKSKGDSYRLIPFEILAEYLAHDVYITYTLVKMFYDMLRDDRGSKIYPWDIYLSQDMHVKRILNPVNNVLVKAELIGSIIDEAALDLLIEAAEPAVAQRKKEIEEDIFNMSGEEVDAASSKQLLKGLHACELLLEFDSTDKKILSKHIKIPLIKKILEYRKATKMLSTYYRGTKEAMVDLGDGVKRLFTRFSIVGTIGSRWSSANKNLQQVPRKDPYKKCFIAADGMVFFQNDFSGLEARVAALLSGDEVLAQACRDDLHTTVAKSAFAGYITELEKLESVEEALKYVSSKAMLMAIREGMDRDVADGKATLESCQKMIMSHLRSCAKVISFGIFFGRGPKALAEEELMCSVSEAQHFIDEYFKLFPKFHKWIQAVRKLVETVGYIVSPCGKVRDLRYWRFSPNPAVRRMHFARAVRQAINFLTQTFAGSLNNLAVIAADRYMTKHKCGYVFGAVHDSTLMQLKLDKFTKQHYYGIKKAQESVFKSKIIEFETEGEIGPNWFDSKEITEKMWDKLALDNGLVFV